MSHPMERANELIKLYESTFERPRPVAKGRKLFTGLIWAPRISSWLWWMKRESRWPVPKGLPR